MMICSGARLICMLLFIYFPGEHGVVITPREGACVELMHPSLPTSPSAQGGSKRQDTATSKFKVNGSMLESHNALLNREHIGSIKATVFLDVFLSFQHHKIDFWCSSLRKYGTQHVREANLWCWDEIWTLVQVWKHHRAFLVNPTHCDLVCFSWITLFCYLHETCS